MFGGGCPAKRVRLIAEQCEWKLKFAAHQSKPGMCFKNVSDVLMSQLQPVNPKAPRTPMDFVPPPDDIDFGTSGPPCVDMTIKNNNKVVLSSCVARGHGKSGSGVKMTEDFMTKYEPLVMIVEMVLGANVKYGMSPDTNLTAMEGRFREAGYEMQTLTAYAEHWIPHRRARFYIVCVHKQKFAAMHGGSIALPMVMHDLKSLWQDRFCNITVPSDYALCMKDFLLPHDHPLVQAHLQQLDQRAPAAPPNKKRRLSESAPPAEIEAEQDEIKWHNVHKVYYESIGLEYKPEHENSFRFQYADCLWYRARPAREREIILAEDEKNPVGFVGTEEEKSLDESAIVVSHRVSYVRVFVFATSFFCCCLWWDVFRSWVAIGRMFSLMG